MKKIRSCLVLSSLFIAAAVSIAADSHSAQEHKEDIARHRAMAGAHTTAARCLAANSDPASCQAALKSSCTGLGMGKYCGLKHDAWAQAGLSLTKTAQAHLAVAACLERGQDEDRCLSDLQSACKGLALGQFCGMVHAH